ncbi:hypothetical protein LXL04_020823 [Taraxacum kok-saghyz]
MSTVRIRQPTHKIKRNATKLAYRAVCTLHVRGHLRASIFPKFFGVLIWENSKKVPTFCPHIRSIPTFLYIHLVNDLCSKNLKIKAKNINICRFWRLNYN